MAKKNRPSWGGSRIENGSITIGGGLTSNGTTYNTRRYQKTTSRGDSQVIEAYNGNYDLYVNGQPLRYKDVKHGDKYFVRFTTELGPKNTIFTAKSMQAAKEILNGVGKKKSFEVSSDKFFRKLKK